MTSLKALRGSLRQAIQRFLGRHIVIASALWYYLGTYRSLFHWAASRLHKAPSISEQLLTIVFVTGEARVREAKLAYALKLSGFKVVLLHKNNARYGEKERTYFDRIIQFENLWDALHMIDEIKPDAVHLFANYDSLYYFPIVGLARCPVVYDPYDVIIGMFNSEHDFHFLHKWAEKFCIEHSDQICARSLELVVSKREFGYRLRNVIYFPDYCWKKPQKQKLPHQGVHIVYCGGVYPEDRYPREKFGYGQFLDIVRSLTNQSIHFHIYPASGLSPDAFDNFFRIYIEEADQNHYFHFHRSLPHSALMQEISHYDFALHVFGIAVDNELGWYTESKPRYSPSNRLFDYMEAGLPIVIHSGLHGRGLVRHYGIAVEAKHLDNLAQILPSFQNMTYPEKLSATIEFHAPRLRDMYLKLCQGRF
ncbi:MAG: hypothetical protein ABIL62_18155 [Planctomycetota bacterium]